MRLFLILLLLSTPSFASEYLDKSFEKAALNTKVPVTLLRAVCYAESLHKFNAYNHSDAVEGGNNHAFGLCQLLRTTAFQYVRPDKKCERDFRKDPETKKLKLARTYKECKLFGIYTNAYAAGKHLRMLLDRYENSWVHAIAAYNSGKPRTCPKKGFFSFKVWNSKKQKWQTRKVKCPPGGLMNEEYVDRVLHALEKGR